MRSSIICFLFILVCQVYAQDWEKYFGQEGKYNISKDIVEDYDKGYLILGRNYFESDPNWISQSWLLKTDINGNLLWDITFVNNDQLVHFGAIEKCNDGGTLFCGTIHANNNYYPSILKLNPCGEKEWCHRIPGAQNQMPWAEDIKELPNGNIAMLVNMFGDGTYESMHLFLMDSFGSILWQYPFCSGFEHDLLRPLGEGIQITSDNKIIICGSSYWKNPWEPGSDVYAIRPTFTKIDTESGEEEWVMPIGLEDTITGDALSFIEIDQNNFIGLASDWRGEAETNPIFIRFNSNGQLLDHRTIYAEDIDESFTEGSFYNFAIHDSNYFLNGVFEIGYGGYSPLITAKIDTNLFLAEPLIIDYNIHHNIDGPLQMIKTYDNKFLNSATFQEPGNWDIYLTKLNLNLEQDSIYSGTYTYDSLCPFPINSGFITLDDCFPVGINDEISTPKDYFDNISTIPVNVYPNPASGKVYLTLKNTAFHSNIILKAYNIHGQLIEKQKILTGQQEVIININHWVSGIYELIITSNSQNIIVGEKKLLVK